MTRAEMVAVITLAGEAVSLRLRPEQRITRQGTAIHEAAHSIVALRLGVVPVRVVLHPDGGGVTEFSEDASRSPGLSDRARANGVAMIAAPDGDLRDQCIWLSRMRHRAMGLVNKHWPHIRALSDHLLARGELTREEILALGPSWQIPAEGGTIARCGQR